METQKCWTAYPWIYCGALSLPRIRAVFRRPPAGCAGLNRRSANSCGLEAQIGVTLFDRSGRYPKLTPEGLVLLADARGVISGVDFMKARAKGMA